ncbi:hypothetical protein [Sorangium sp. So ce1335]|uniref:hypothetical protein n=1 Tax=Sorangium sp. So ce1335 TaxID=3133335 RepID=UPI003F5DE08A
MRDPTRAAAVASIGDYIDTVYNLKRRHSRLACVIAIAYEVKAYVTALAVW